MKGSKLGWQTEVSQALLGFKVKDAARPHLGFDISQRLKSSKEMKGNNMK